jgi:hypothetical protein
LSAVIVLSAVAVVIAIGAALGVILPELKPGRCLWRASVVPHGQARDPAFASRPVYSAVVVTSALVVAGLSLATVRTIQLSNWRDAATRIGSTWARGYDERLVQARFDGSTLVLLVEGESDGAQDAQLPELLQGEVPEGTPVVVNRIPGRSTSVGEVPR